ncbi:MAG: family 16 glycosylhydrolase [Steroidobacteraceae bacterium]
MSGRRLRSIVSATTVVVAGSVIAGAEAARRPAKPPKAEVSFVDWLDVQDTQRWSMADGWTNGPPFDNGWAADHVRFSNGLLEILLDDQSTRGEPYTSGEYRTNGFHGYGCFEASFRPIAVPGVVTSLFTYAGPYDNGGNGLHNEIDIEFLGNGFRDDGKTLLQFNFWTNYSGGPTNEIDVLLPFDASADFHRYGFRWTSAGITWFVDGEAVFEVLDDPAAPTPKATESLQKLMLNAWPVDASASGWAGEFRYPGSPLVAQYEWVRHLAGEGCSLENPPVEPPPPPPPTGVETDLSVADIGLSVVARGAQVVSLVRVTNGLGVGVPGVAVSASWSGAVTSGDRLRETDANGLASFYSSRTKATGEVVFCVDDLALAGFVYRPGANLESCDRVLK